MRPNSNKQKQHVIDNVSLGDKRNLRVPREL